MQCLKLFRYQLVAVVIAIFFCGFAHAARTGFEDVPTGPFLTLKTPVGVWSDAEASQGWI